MHVGRRAFQEATSAKARLHQGEVLNGEELASDERGQSAPQEEGSGLTSFAPTLFNSCQVSLQQPSTAQNLGPTTCTSSNNITLTPKRNLHPPSYAISPKSAVSSMPPQRDPTYEEIPSFAPQTTDDCDLDKETDANIYDSVASEKDRGVFQSLENTLDRSKPYLPVLESSSQLVESIVVEDPDRIVIDATPGKKKKGTKRKRKEEPKEKEVCYTHVHLHTCTVRNTCVESTHTHTYLHTHTNHMRTHTNHIRTHTRTCMHACMHTPISHAYVSRMLHFSKKLNVHSHHK